MKYTIGTNNIYTAEILMGLAEWLDANPVEKDLCNELAPALSTLLSEVRPFIDNMSSQRITDQHDEWMIVLVSTTRISESLDKELP